MFGNVHWDICTTYLFLDSSLYQQKCVARRYNFFADVFRAISGILLPCVTYTVMTCVVWPIQLRHTKLWPYTCMTYINLTYNVRVRHECIWISTVWHTPGWPSFIPSDARQVKWRGWSTPSCRLQRILATFLHKQAVTSNICSGQISRNAVQCRYYR